LGGGANGIDHRHPPLAAQRDRGSREDHSSRRPAGSG